MSSMRLCTNRTVAGHGLAGGLGQHARRCVDSDDLGVRGDGQQRGGGCAGAAAGVEQAQSAAELGEPHALCRISQVRWYPGLAPTSRS